MLELPGLREPHHALPRVRTQPYPCFLDSGRDPDGVGRRSYLACRPFLVVHSKGSVSRLTRPREGREESWSGDPFRLLKELLAAHRSSTPSPFPLAAGGAIGYFGYDLLHHVEEVPSRSRDDLGMPDLFLAFYDAVAVFDHSAGRAWLATSATADGAMVEELRQLFTRPDAPTAPGTAQSLRASELSSNFTRSEYLAAIEKIREYIVRGDVYQVNLSQRFSAPFRGDPLEFYQRLRAASPAPFGACLFPDGFSILSNSPERYLLIDEAGYIETRPIKGTRPRGRTPAEDEALAEELRRSEKDRAEHVMIVDLERNDLGRVCEYASVHVPQLETVESYANVHHLVSTVAGRVHPARDAVDCIRNSFPGGSITGAPKVKAMEIIDELEPTCRGVYCGSIGYIDFSGRVDLNIAIRTAIVRDGQVYFQAGGGIVMDSDPAEEYEETLTKAQSFLRVLTGTSRGWEL
ncbi:MAG: aminodeoxychorismate synthase component I [Deltaproteobacteria bacterium]|nr:aminodeoxychorismate synthase component I [Deltaproteobacteria bacterium]